MEWPELISSLAVRIASAVEDMMQLLDTVVTYNAAGPVVEFIGECEKISVSMAPRPGATSDDLIDAARVMLVHPANFGACPRRDAGRLRALNGQVLG